MKREPLLNAGFILAFIGGAITVATQFGLNLTKDQVAAILGFVTISSPILTALTSRGYVTPVSDPRVTTPRGVIPLVPSPYDPTGGSTIGNTPLSVLGTGSTPGNVLAPGGTTALQQTFNPGNVVAPGGSVPFVQSFSGGSAGQLSAPVVTNASFATTGGTLVPGWVGYRLTVTNALGETGPGQEFAFLVPTGTSTNTVTLNWTSDPNATSTKIYGRTIGGEKLMATVGAGVGTWTDTGSVTPSGAMPLNNTTGTPAVALGGTQTPGNVIAPGGSVPLQQGVDPTP